MKRRNKNVLTLMLAGTLCAATMGAVAIAPVQASAATAAKTYALTTVFNTNNTQSSIDGDNGKTLFELGNNESVEYDRNLAIKWFTGKDAAKYATLSFTLADLNFTKVTFTFESAAMHATKDDKAVNVVKLTKGEGDVVSVQVNDGATKETAIAAGSVVTLSLDDAGTALGAYNVNLAVDTAAAEAVGTFENIGAKYFSTDSTLKSLVIGAETSGANTKIYLNEINGQRFDNVENDNVKDTAAPVLVVNEDISGFLLGTQFKLDFTEIDVLATSKITKTRKYYQYNPADTEVKYDATLTPNSSTGTYFMDTMVYKSDSEAGVYSKEKKDGYTQTSVFREFKAEYVSIQFTLGDDTYSGEGEDEHCKAVYDLSWYAETVKTFKFGETETDYIILNRNTNGPTLAEWADEADKAKELEAYQNALNAKAATVYAGSNAEVQLPSLDWLIKDNNGYKSMKFTISYKTPSSSSAKTSSNIASDKLKISATEQGMYEFKVFATDAAGNPMKVEVVENEGEDNETREWVEVTSSNVWDLDSVPSFRFSVKDQGMKIDDDEDDDTLDTQILDETYTMSSLDIVGANSEQSSYALYKINLGAYTAGTITSDTLSKIKYADLKAEAQSLIAKKLSGENAIKVQDIDYAAINVEAYANLVAKAIKANAPDVQAIFEEIEAYNDRITEDNEEAWNNSDNKYNWKPDSKSFKAAEAGMYVIIADFWDADFAFVDHTPAYQLVEVESEADVIKGETEWLKNNLVSVILFSVAGLMLILIIILLLIKPSDETLEDLDEKVVSKRKAATDRNKKK